MAALPTSLRRTLLVLLGFMVTLIIMVFYWNQNATRMPSAALSNAFLMPVERHKNISPEKSWTYKCVDDKCVREHYSSGEKRTPFMTCAMVCGMLNIWPMPTIKASLSTRSLTFDTAQLEFNVHTKFDEAKKLLHSAYHIFLFDLKSMEDRATTASSSRSHTNGNSSSNSGNSGSHNNNKNQKTANADNEQKPQQADDGNDSNKNADPSLATNVNDGEPKHRACDINKIIINAEIVKAPDVHLHMDIDERYELNVTHVKGTVRVHISANTFFGARHGLSTLQQMIWYDDADGALRILKSAHIEDEPKFRFRGLMLDTSRNYFSKETIKRTIVGMSHTKMNRFHWHITDSQSFPYMSKAYPQLAKYGAYSSKEIYTGDDIKEIAEFARVRGIQIIPEIDTPSHSGNGWNWGPEHGLGELAMCVNQQPWSYYCGEPPCGQLNPKNNHTYAILEKLYTELLELTGPTDYFHIGGDEVNLECWSQFFNDTDLRALWCDFMLQAFERLKKANKNVAPKIVAVWSSPLTSTQCLSHRDFAVQIWGGSDWQENYALMQNGFNVVLSHVDKWYLDCGFGSWRTTGEGACSPYTTWHHAYKHRPWDKMRLDPIKMKQILGGEACLWTEQVDENNVDSRIWPRTAAIAERLWSDPIDVEPDSVPKDLFRRMSIFRNRLIDFGLQAEPIFPKYCGQNQDECA